MMSRKNESSKTESSKSESSKPDDYRLAENKLLLLYLIDKMDIPLSNGQISQFALEENYMNYFFIQKCLSEMIEINYLEATQENNNTRYTITDDGLETLKYFEKHISANIRSRINTYVLENRRKLKRDFEITANYFLDNRTKEFIVKCGVYEDSKVLMELNISVVTREHAKLIVGNWKNSSSEIYNDILDNLVNGKEQIDKEQ